MHPRSEKFGHILHFFSEYLQRSQYGIFYRLRLKYGRNKGSRKKVGFFLVALPQREGVKAGHLKKNNFF